VPPQSDVVINLVAGPQWPQLLNVLRTGGRYAVAAAVGGPIAEIDVCTLYLKDLTPHGCTFQPDDVFENLIGYIGRDEFATYPPSDIVRAQQDFLARKHIGKLVLTLPSTT
jgi:NADPH:quinone reductase-like Zn-dependent oxidoreductase